MMWPPEDSQVEYQLVGECPSCRRDLNGALPKLPLTNPDALRDAEIVALWRFWTQSYHFTAGMGAEDECMDEFWHWLNHGAIESPPDLEFEEWEHEFLAAFRPRYLVS